MDEKKDNSTETPDERSRRITKKQQAAYNKYLIAYQKLEKAIKEKKPHEKIRQLTAECGTCFSESENAKYSYDTDPNKPNISPIEPVKEWTKFMPKKTMAVCLGYPANLYRFNNAIENGEYEVEQEKDNRQSYRLCTNFPKQLDDQTTKALYKA